MPPCFHLRGTNKQTTVCMGGGYGMCNVLDNERYALMFPSVFCLHRCRQSLCAMWIIVPDIHQCLRSMFHSAAMDVPYFMCSLCTLFCRLFLIVCHFVCYTQYWMFTTVCDPIERWEYVDQSPILRHMMQCPFNDKCELSESSIELPVRGINLQDVLKKLHSS